MIRQFKRLALAPLVLASAIALTACLEPGAPADPPTPENAARFLTQATFGPTPEDINHLVDIGYEAWLTEQFNTPQTLSHFEYVDHGGPPDCYWCNAFDVWGPIESFWYHAIGGKDQLRQRVAWAYLETFVVSGATDGILFHESDSLGSYMDTLSQNAFGNFRDLLEAITLSPTMGRYLSHVQNEKEDPTTGRLPDENYAREVMQLFTIGKWQLNSDGTRAKDTNGQDIPAYTQDDVMGLARVLTGWSWGGPDTSETRWRGDLINGERTRIWTVPMQPYEQYHSTLEKRIVGGVVIPPNTKARDSLKIALDTLFNHPNTPPFVATMLIKRLTTSNPSPAYVQRVATVFSSNKDGVRGDMKSVIRAVLFDPEVWDGTHLTNPEWGKAKEPVVKVAALMRAFSCKASNGIYRLGSLQTDDYDIGQPPLMSNSVFNFFQPEYAPPGEVADTGLTAPEFQITDNNTLVGFLNVAHYMLDYGFYGPKDEYRFNCDFSTYTPVAADAGALVKKLTDNLMGVPLQASVQKTIIDTVNTIPLDGTTASQEARVKTATMLMLASPDYNIQR